MCTTYFCLRGSKSGAFVRMDAAGRLSFDADPARADAFCAHYARTIARRAARLTGQAIERLPIAEPAGPNAVRPPATTH